MSGTLTASTTDDAAPTYAVTEQPLHGSVTLDGDRLTYRAQVGFAGSDTLTYTAATGGATSSPAVVHIRIDPSAAAPVIAPIEAITVQGAPATREITATAPGSTTLALQATGLPAGATFQDLGGGRGLLTVDPAGAAPGSSATATITAVSDGGTATAPVRITVAGNRAPTVPAMRATTPYQQAATLVATASDPDGDALTFAVRTPPAHGTVTNTGATFTCTPRPPGTAARTASGVRRLGRHVDDERRGRRRSREGADPDAHPDAHPHAYSPSDTDTDHHTQKTPTPAPACARSTRPGTKADISVTLTAPTSLKAADDRPGHGDRLAAPALLSPARSPSVSCCPAAASSRGRTEARSTAPG